MEFVLHSFEPFEHLVEFLGRNVLPHTADFADALDHPAARGRFHVVEHVLPESPCVHKDALKTHPVGKKPEPEEVGVQP